MKSTAISRIFLSGYAAAMLVVSSGGANATESESVFSHPGIAHTRASIDFVKGKLKSSEEPWTSAWQQLKESSYASLDWEAEPRAHVERGPSNNPNIGSSEFTRDGTAAYTLALRWAISGDKRYAEKSAEIIDAWSKTLKSISNHDARLLIGMDGQKYCNAAELLKHTWDGRPQLLVPYSWFASNHWAMASTDATSSGLT